MFAESSAALCGAWRERKKREVFLFLLAALLRAAIVSVCLLLPPIVSVWLLLPPWLWLGQLWYGVALYVRVLLLRLLQARSRVAGHVERVLDLSRALGGEA